MKKQLQKKAEDLFSKLHSICEDFFKVHDYFTLDFSTE